MKEQYKKDFIRAGSIASQVRAFGTSLIKPGASYNAVIAQIYQKIRELGAIPAFPPQIALDDVAAHFLPQPDTDILFSDQVVKLDVGICFNGAIGDCAGTLDLSGKHQNLVDAAEAALLRAEQSIKVGLPIRQIGSIIAETIASFGLKPIKNLSGHGLGHYQIHTMPTIPNYDDQSKGIIQAGMTFAIEPFATDGKGLIYESSHPTIFCFQQTRPVKSPHAKALLLKIHRFQGLPFSLHDVLSEELSLLETKQALSELIALQVIAGYPPLIEEGRGKVAQAENSVLVDLDGKVLITTRGSPI
jgi:methionyl aminopeptidase